MTKSEARTHLRPLGLRCLVLAVVLHAVAILGTESEVSLGASLYLAVVYLLLGTLLVLLQNLLTAVPAGRWVGAFIVSLVVVWHVREQTGMPSSLWAVLAAAAVLALVARLLRVDGLDGNRLVLAAAGVAAMFALSLFVGFVSSDLLRWHLLRHNTLLGTPLYYLLAEPVPVVEQALTAPHRGTDPEPRPPVALLPEVDPESALVYVLIDTLRADSLSAWGATEVRMPLLDRRSEQCHRFTDVLVNSSWTRPSIGSLFTGLLPEEHGARNFPDRLPESVQTLAEVFEESGWETAAFVTNTAAIGEELGFAQGFEFFHEFPQEPYVRARGVQRAVESWLDRREEPAERPEEPAKRPLFLYLHYLDPHEPYLAGVVPRRPTRSEFRAAYDAELRELDAELGPFLDRLLERLGPKTQLILVSDHGEEFYEHELFGHGHSLYDEVVRVPAMLCRSDDEGARLSARLEGRDLFALTLAAAADPELDLRHWAARHARTERYLSLYYTGEGRLQLRPYRRFNLMRAIDRSRERLIWSGYGETVELYGARDPGQLRNLSAAQPETVEDLRSSLDNHPRYWTFPEPFEGSDELRRRLESLGYIDD